MRCEFLLLLPTISAFTVLPYIQIDYAHYFRLAQCKAKCTEKFGVITRRNLLDGSVDEYMENQSEDGKQCELGCQQHRRGYRKQTRSSRSPIHDGAAFWKESSADAAKVGTSPISSIAMLCQNPSMNGEFEETAQGLVGVRLVRPAGSVKYVVQWKQRTYALGAYDESPWITASIESSPIFSVDGFIPGVHYRFQVTVVGPQGRLGDSLLSDWAEVDTSVRVRAPGGHISAKNGYNGEDGVTANVHWQHTSFDSCHWRITLANNTHNLQRDFTMDQSASVLMPNLEFDCEYSVSIAALSLSRPMTSRYVFQSGEADSSEPRASRALQTHFRSYRCQQVHGKGSINCAPEPVSDLKVVVRSNGSTLVSWTPAAETDNVLTYQVSYQSKTLRKDCQTENKNVYLNAATTTAEISLIGEADCDYVIRLINYDLLGREAVAETRVRYRPPTINILAHLQLEVIVIIGCVLLLFSCCVFLKCTLSRQCPVKVSEKSQRDKLTDCIV